MPGSKLLARIHEVAQKHKLRGVAVAFHDYESALHFSFQGDRLFHAASTYKAAILFALFKAVEAGRVQLDDWLHVRNRFISIIDGSPYRLERERDGDSQVHRSVGRAMSLHQLAKAMIVRSSNVATNLLLEHLTLPFIKKVLEDCGVEGLHVRRGVEDHLAFEQGVNNETTADALLKLFRVFHEGKALTEEHREQALAILFAQEFNSMIPARLPEGVRVAHKTGEISTHCHDAGVVYPPDRQPYALAILTETDQDTERRTKAVAEISGAVYRYLSISHKEEKHHE